MIGPGSSMVKAGDGWIPAGSSVSSAEGAPPEVGVGEEKVAGSSSCQHRHGPRSGGSTANADLWSDMIASKASLMNFQPHAFHALL